MTIDQIETATRELGSLCRTYGIEYITHVLIDGKAFTALLRYSDFHRVFAEHDVKVTVARQQDQDVEFCELAINGIKFTCNRSLPTHSTETDFLAELVSGQ